MLTSLQYHLLRSAWPGGKQVLDGSAYRGKSKLAALLGPDFLNAIRGRSVIDFGCGEGDDAIEMARRGAGRVTGIDIREEVLEKARLRAVEAGVGHICQFRQQAAEPADLVISLDSFEHFADPAGALAAMESLLASGGEIFVSFGPTWYHPLGGHLFSVFPWAHLLLSEKALLRWRSTFKNDGATRFGEVSGGLNQMTIWRFEELAKRSRLRVESLELVPIRKLQAVHNRLTREFTTAIVRCHLVKNAAGHQF